MGFVEKQTKIKEYPDLGHWPSMHGFLMCAFERLH